MAVLYKNDTIGPSSEYKATLEGQHRGTKWGSTGAKYTGGHILGLLNKRPGIKTILDFGAGKASMGEFIQERVPGLDWTNYDPGIPGIDVLPDRQFDLVLSTDVLEHIEPDRLDKTLRSMAERVRPGGAWVSDIACSLTGTLFTSGPFKGQDLHLIVENPEWWRERILEATKDVGNGFAMQEYHRVMRLFKGEYIERAFFLHDKF